VHFIIFNFFVSFLPLAAHIVDVAVRTASFSVLRHLSSIPSTLSALRSTLYFYAHKKTIHFYAFANMNGFSTPTNQDGEPVPTLSQGFYAAPLYFLHSRFYLTFDPQILICAEIRIL
jgi:hypothetical protein